MPTLDVLNPEKENWLAPAHTGLYRHLYFIRRTLATLREFAEALELLTKDMDKDPSLRPTFVGLSDEAPALWDAAMQFFKTNRTLLEKIRNDVGGHFGHPAALNALSLLQPEACGTIVLAQRVVESRGQRDMEADQQLRLPIATEIVGTALLKHLPNADIAQYGAFVTDFLKPAYQHAINCVYILVREHLWERFGS